MADIIEAIRRSSTIGAARAPDSIYPKTAILSTERVFVDKEKLADKIGLVATFCGSFVFTHPPESFSENLQTHRDNLIHFLQTVALPSKLAQQIAVLQVNLLSETTAAQMLFMAGPEFIYWVITEPFAVTESGWCEVVAARDSLGFEKVEKPSAVVSIRSSPTTEYEFDDLEAVEEFVDTFFRITQHHVQAFLNEKSVR